MTEPLDDEQGVGLLDAQRAVLQHQGGRQGPGNVSTIGWDLRELAAADGLRSYSINANLASGSFITVTLCWDRIIDEREAGGAAGDGIVEEDDTYVDRPAGGADLGVLPNFNLYIYKGGVKVAESVASAAGLSGENVEHLHFPVATAGDDYSVRVSIDGGLSTKKYDYALAWWTSTSPVA